MGTLFTMKGRLSRKQYILASLGLYVAAMVLAVAMGFVAGLAGMSEAAAGNMGFVLGVVATVVQAFFVVRRLHDLGRPGAHYWLLLVPLYNLYIYVVLLFTKGANGSNQYGSDPTTA